MSEPRLCAGAKRSFGLICNFVQSILQCSIAVLRRQLFENHSAENFHKKKLSDDPVEVVHSTHIYCRFESGIKFIRSAVLIDIDQRNLFFFLFLACVVWSTIEPNHMNINAFISTVHTNATLISHGIDRISPTGNHSADATILLYINTKTFVCSHE